MVRMIAISIVMLLPLSASSGYINNYGQWNSLAQNRKSAYAMAVWDYYSVVLSSTATPEEITNREATIDCFRSASLNSEQLAALIDMRYQQNAAHWAMPPIVMLLGGFFEMCKPMINQRRIELGYGPIK